MKILVLEPYHGGSHKRFLDSLEQHLPFSFSRLTQPPRGWKWRMRFSAPEFARRLRADPIGPFDLVLASTFVSIADFRALAPPEISTLPVVVYWHENQWAYPVRHEDERDRHFVITNYTTALAADLNLFNSRWNLESFSDGLRSVLREVPDSELSGTIDEILARSSVLPPPIAAPPTPLQPTGNAVPRILWNHRWEHDKNPEEFFRALFQATERGTAFELLVLGESFREAPAIFEEARERLADRIVHWGFVADRSEYLRLVDSADLVVSTATHEFFGLSVLEAALRGARPLVPDHLSYPEIYPEECRYPPGKLSDCLDDALQRSLTETPWAGPLERFQWPDQKPLWERILRAAAGCRAPEKSRD